MYNIINAIKNVIKTQGDIFVSNIIYTSKNNFFLKASNSVSEYPALRIKQYAENVRSIQQKRKWKTSGDGAKFMGTNEYHDPNEENYGTSINGVAVFGDKIVYSVSTGDVSGLYIKTLDKNGTEGLVHSSNNMCIQRISVHGDKCAASMGDLNERHISVFNLNSSDYKTLTDGDVLEDYPSYSPDGKKLFYSCAGLAISPQGFVLDTAPFGINCYYEHSNSIEAIFFTEDHDCILPKEDANGNLYFIKRPYKGTEQDKSLFFDLLLFPVRIIRTIFGLLNFFSIAFGGESLRSGRNTASDIRSKQKNKQELFFEGNMINAEQALKKNRKSGEKFPGIIPSAWELVCLDKSGRLKTVKKGVMDYALCDNGDILYSNGHAIIRSGAGKSEELVEKCHLASNITPFVAKAFAVPAEI